MKLKQIYDLLIEVVDRLSSLEQRVKDVEAQISGIREGQNPRDQMTLLTRLVIGLYVATFGWIGIFTYMILR